MRRKHDLMILIHAASTLFLVCSIPIIEEKCLFCGKRVLQGNAPLRKLSIIEWALDHTQDYHFTCFQEICK